MKFDCGPTPKERHEAKKQWHRLFAWWPTRVGHRDCRWLEFIQRRGTYHCGYGYMGSWWEWEYRA